MTKKRNVFLDRDGTIIEDKHYLSNPCDIVLLPNVGNALASLVTHGYQLFLVTNQSGVGRGFFVEDDVWACQQRLNELLETYQVVFTDVLWCIHDPTDQCVCRKPKIGMWKELSKRHGLISSETIMIGDKIDDVLFGIDADFAATYLVKTGKGEEEGKKVGYCFPEKHNFVYEIDKKQNTVIMTSNSLSDVVSWILQK